LVETRTQETHPKKFGEVCPLGTGLVIRILVPRDVAFITEEAGQADGQEVG